MSTPPLSHLIVVGGPTASGKTALAIALARHFGTVVLSADSRQFYREMRIGTARPSDEELASVPHYFIADRSLEQELSAGAYAREALDLLRSVFEHHRTAVVVGGSGLFIQALTEGLHDFPEVPATVQQAVQQLYDTGGLPALQAEVAQLDPQYYATVDQQNPARLMRAIAVCRSAGRPYSDYRQGSRAARPFQAHYLTPYVPRPLLYRHIDERVDRMLAAGLVEEAGSLLAQRECRSLRTVGYQELFAYFDGASSLAEARTLIQRNSRRYAKRQLTWLRRDGYWKHLDAHDHAAAIDYAQWVQESTLSLVASSSDGFITLAYESPEGIPQARVRLRTQRQVVEILDYQPGGPYPWLLHEVVRRYDQWPVHAAGRSEWADHFRAAGFSLGDSADATWRRVPLLAENSAH